VFSFKLTSARWQLITSRKESFSACVSFPSETKYRLWTTMRVCTVCWQTEEDRQSAIVPGHFQNKSICTFLHLNQKKHCLNLMLFYFGLF